MQEDRNNYKCLGESPQKAPANSQKYDLFDFSRLPWDVFLHILRYFRPPVLCRLCLVNKQWHRACLDPSLWQKLELVGFYRMTDKDLIRCALYSNNVVVLKIGQSFERHIFTDFGVCSALRHCPSLVECSISNCRDLSDAVLMTLGECCHKVQKLDITLSFNFTDKGMKKVCEGCPNLEEIKMDQCAHLTNLTLVNLGRYSAQLRHISTGSITNLTDQGVLALLQGCRKLETLRMPLCGLTNQSVGYIVNLSAEIVYLDLRGVILEDKHVHDLSTCLTNVVTLNLGLCVHLTDVAVTVIAKCCTKIKNLFLVSSKTTDEGLFQLGTHSQSLVRLDVSWCKEVTEVGVRKILECCPNLEHLGLFRCDKVSELAMDELSLKFPHVFISTLQTEMRLIQQEGNISHKIRTSLLE